MKKIILVLFTVILSCSAAMSQLAITGAFGFGTGSTSNIANNVTVNGPKSMDFTFVPKVEFFLSEQMSVGAGLGYARSSIKTIFGTITSVASQNYFVVNPFARYYFITGDKGGIFAEAFVNAQFGSALADVNNVKTKTDKLTSIVLGVGPGFELALSDKFALEGSFGLLCYSINKDEDVTTTPSTIFKANNIIFDVNDLGFALVGIKYYISK